MPISVLDYFTASTTLQGQCHWQHQKYFHGTMKKYLNQIQGIHLDLVHTWHLWQEQPSCFKCRQSTTQISFELTWEVIKTCMDSWTHLVAYVFLCASNYMAHTKMFTDGIYVGKVHGEFDCLKCSFYMQVHVQHQWTMHCLQDCMHSPQTACLHYINNSGHLQLKENSFSRIL